jgi:hypothetical protein
MDGGDGDETCFRMHVQATLRADVGALVSKSSAKKQKRSKTAKQIGARGQGSDRRWRRRRGDAAAARATLLTAAAARTWMFLEGGLRAG